MTVEVEEYQTVDWLNECNCEAHKKKVDVELLYNSVNTGIQLVWRPDQMETRCGRESQHPAEGALRPPIEQLGIRRVGEKILEWEHVLERLGPVEQLRRTGKKRGYGQ